MKNKIVTKIKSEKALPGTLHHMKHIFTVVLWTALVSVFVFLPIKTYAGTESLTNSSDSYLNTENSNDEFNSDGITDAVNVADSDSVESDDADFELDFSIMNLPEYTGGKTELNIYNWGQYICDGSDGYINVIEEFEKAYPDIKINYMTFDSNESMYTKLQTSGSSYDLIIPSDYMIEKLIREDMVEPIDYSNIPNYELVDDSFKNMDYDPDNVYTVPYTWGRVGIIYNSAYVNEEDAQGWDLLWNSNYAGKILMFDNCRDAFAVAEHLLGYSLNTEDTEELEAAAQKLTEQKTLVQSYVMDQIFDKMQRAEAWIAPYYAGDYLFMVEENPDLKFCTPKEGFNLFVDACCIPKGAEHKLAAELFINFLCEPQISGQNLEFIGYSTPISAAKEYMDPSVSESEVAYPSDEVLEGGESFKALSDEGNQLMNELWLNVKTSNSLLLDYLIPVVVIIVVIVGIWLFFAIRKKKSKARRCTH